MLLLNLTLALRPHELLHLTVSESVHLWMPHLVLVVFVLICRKSLGSLWSFLIPLKLVASRVVAFISILAHAHRCGTGTIHTSEDSTVTMARRNGCHFLLLVIRLPSLVKSRGWLETGGGHLVITLVFKVVGHVFRVLFVAKWLIQLTCLGFRGGRDVSIMTVWADGLQLLLVTGGYRVDVESLRNYVRYLGVLQLFALSAPRFRPVLRTVRNWARGLRLFSCAHSI